MIVPVYSVSYMRGAAEALESASLESVKAAAPVYVTRDSEGIEVLHPLVATGWRIGHPFSFDKLGLTVAASDTERILTLRLLPPSGKKISTPIAKPEEPDFYRHLPAVGFSALKVIVEVGQGDKNQLLTFGEEAADAEDQALMLPSQETAAELIIVACGQVIAKSFQALHAHQQRPQS